MSGGEEKRKTKKKSWKKGKNKWYSKYRIIGGWNKKGEM